jgi:quercetin dioxygenase-like cupin family protein
MVGGKQTAAGQHRGTDIKGGQTTMLKKGDVVTIPAGVPHWFKDVPATISYLTIKVIK